MRLATMVTPRGLRLHVRARSGYVDVADGTGNPQFATLRGLLRRARSMRCAACWTARAANSRPAEFGPAVPEPRRILCLGVNYREHAIEGGRAGADLAGGLRPRRGQRAGAVRGPGPAGPHRPVRLRG